MMKQTKAISASAVFLLVLSATGCKPTEKNYKTAYDVALSKAAKEKEALGPMVPEELQGSFVREDAYPTVKVDGREIMYIKRVHHDAETDMRTAPGFYPVVSAYKMSTNARSNTQQLREAGFDAVTLKVDGSRWLVSLGRAETLEAAALLLDRYGDKYRDARYIGLPGGPVIEESY